MSVKTWLITGCSSGIGRELAELLLERGERVVATARKPESVEALVAPYAERALSLKLDITKPDDIANALTLARERFGAIDVLVNNAGSGHVGTIEETPIDAAREVFETNLFGALAMIKAVLPEMRQRRAGQIVNIGSVAGLIGFPALGYYSAAKFALTAMTESLAAEVKAFGIKVTVVVLGPFATDFTRSMTYSVPAESSYDIRALSHAAGTSHWGGGHDPRDGAVAILSAISDPSPPLRLIVGPLGLEVVELYEAKRLDERKQWIETTRLRG
jgi:NAD(P)-dependent dehydrogenase (short-subunit alcohol dehydrogenase family)